MIDGENVDLFLVQISKIARFVYFENDAELMLPLLIWK